MDRNTRSMSLCKSSRAIPFVIGCLVSSFNCECKILQQGFRSTLALRAWTTFGAPLPPQRLPRNNVSLVFFNRRLLNHSCIAQHRYFPSLSKPERLVIACILAKLLVDRFLKWAGATPSVELLKFTT
jgi:hypothetical protein